MVKFCRNIYINKIKGEKRWMYDGRHRIGRIPSGKIRGKNFPTTEA